jgi:sortase A
MRLRSFEAASYVLGALLLCSYGAAQGWIAWQADAAVREFRHAIHRDDAGVHGHILRFGQAETADWSTGRVAAHRAAGGGAFPVAVLRIPAVGLEVPVYDGVSELNLNRGAARIEGTAQFTGPGNLGLAAHRDGYFRSLQNVHKGDRIDVLTLGERRQYRVTQLSVVAPQAVEVLAPTEEPTLTLVTCYPFHTIGPAPRRFIVQAEAMRQISQ